jgi:hypothetical protein
MTYLAPADFRTGTLNEVCTGLSLTTTEASDASLTSGIARLSQRIDNYTFDHFESVTDILKLDVDYPTDTLNLPRRTTSVSNVQTQDMVAGLTTQSGSSYRFRSSLNAAGDDYRESVSSIDNLRIVPLGTGLIGSYYGAWIWPLGPQTVWVSGNFGWITTPYEIKQALALMVFYHFKPIRQDLRLAETVSVADSTIRFGQTSPSGIPEVDDILVQYRRDQSAFVG